MQAEMTTKKKPDETPIGEVVSALRACKYLVADGILTLGEVRKRGLANVMKTRYVGQVSMDELRAAIGPQAETPETTAPEGEPEFEESTLPVHLERTPTGPSFIAWSPSHKVSAPGGGHAIQKPMFIEFDEKGKAVVTCRMYWMRKFRRNQTKVDAAIEEGRPWRQACVKALRSEFMQYGIGFNVLTD